MLPFLLPPTWVWVFGDHLPSKQMIHILHIILQVNLHDIYYCHFIMPAYAWLNGLHGTQTQSSLFVITASGCSLCSWLCKCKELMSGLTWFNPLLIVFYLPLLGFHREPAGYPSSVKFQFWSLPVDMILLFWLLCPPMGSPRENFLNATFLIHY